MTQEFSTRDPFFLGGGLWQASVFHGISIKLKLFWIENDLIQNQIWTKSYYLDWISAYSNKPNQN